jgi:nicotinate-nucleotide adenylyltransferase
MKVGLFGGSFDPIHRGHVEPVREVRRLLGLDQVIFLPTTQPPHKAGRVKAPALQRYAMVELALLREDGLVASAHELTAGQPAYTAETLDHFRRELPSAELYLLIGSDSFADLPQWYRYRDILASSRLVVLRRPGWELELDEGSLPELPEGALARVEVPAVRPHAISSTEVRALLARGEAPPPGALDDLVVQFIDKYSLYR